MIIYPLSHSFTFVCKVDSTNVFGHRKERNLSPYRHMSVSFRHNSFIVLVTKNNERVWTEHPVDKRGNSLNSSLLLIKCTVSNDNINTKNQLACVRALGGVDAFTIILLVFVFSAFSSSVAIKVPLPPLRYFEKKTIKNLCIKTDDTSHSLSPLYDSTK